MCDECGITEDEYLVETSKDGKVISLKNLCEVCFQKSFDEEEDAIRSTLENQLKELKEENQVYKDALEEVLECIDSFYVGAYPKRLDLKVSNYSGIINVMHKVSFEALEKYK